MNIAFPGERGAFSELAAIEFFGSNNDFIAFHEFGEVFQSVAAGQCKYGLVPIENSLAGSIHQNYDALLESKCQITGEIYLQIGHFLIANEGVSKKNIKKVFSHPQALAQCKKFLKKYPHLETVSFSNTAIAVKKIKDEKLKNSAAIGSMQAAIDFDMKVLASNIQDNKWNTTRFIALGRKNRNPTRNESSIKSSIVFSTKNIPGALFKCLAVFALRDIDLHKIESRPVHGRGFEYFFYLDFDGDIRNEAQRNAINHLKELTTFYHFLGSYPTGRIVKPIYKKR
jgi:prephenate dehydratase